MLIAPGEIFPPDPEPCRIYGDDNGAIFSLVDACFYQWLVQWKWSPKWSKGNKKVYLRRNVQTTIAPGAHNDRNRVQQTLFLHTAVMQRAGILPPSPAHILVDHRDGDGLNCRLSNLRWATHSMNSKNLHGSHAHEFAEW